MIDTSLFISVLLNILPVLYAVAFFDYILVFVTEDPLVRRLSRPLLSVAIGANFIYYLAFTL